MAPQEIVSDKVKEAAIHKKWLLELEPGEILLYSKGSKTEDGTVSLAWFWVQTRSASTWDVLFEGCCQIGRRSDIEDGKIHAIQEGLPETKNKGL